MLIPRKNDELWKLNGQVLRRDSHIVTSGRGDVTCSLLSVRICAELRTARSLITFCAELKTEVRRPPSLYWAVYIACLNVTVSESDVFITRLCKCPCSVYM